MSRARLGLYVFGRVSLFQNCVELTPTFTQLVQRPLRLHLLPSETYPTSRLVSPPSLHSGLCTCVCLCVRSRVCVLCLHVFVRVYVYVCVYVRVRVCLVVNCMIASMLMWLQIPSRFDSSRDLHTDVSPAGSLCL